MRLSNSILSFGLIAGAGVLFGGCMAQDPASGDQAKQPEESTLTQSAIIAPGVENWTWNRKTGIVKAIDIGCASLSAGKVWATGNKISSNAGLLFKWDGGTVFNNSMNFAANTEIDVGADGRAWFVNWGSAIYQMQPDGTNIAPRGDGYDIGVGANGAVYKIGTNPVGTAGDFGVWRFESGTSWTQMNGGGVRIDVDPTGKAWVVNSAGEVWKMQDVGTSFDLVSGIKAKDIGIGGALGSVYVVSDEAYDANGNFKLYHLTGTNTWKVTNGGGYRVSVDYTNKPWLVTKQGEIYQAKTP